MRMMNVRILLVVLFSLLLVTGFALAQSTTAPPPLRMMALLTNTASPTPTPTLSPTPTAAATPVINRPINIGDVISESLSGMTTSATYFFEGKSGQYVSISLQIDSTYTELHLRDTNGEYLAGGFFDSVDQKMHISAVRLPEDGRYTVAIDRQIGLDTFTLQVTELPVKDIAYGDIITDELTAEQPSVLYRFHGNRFDIIDMSLMSTDFDAYIGLLQSTGFEFTSDDNGGGGRNAYLGLYHLLETDDYLILVRSRDRILTGTFQLRLNRAEFTPLNFDDPVEVNFTADTPAAYFEVEVSGGDVIYVGVDSSNTIDTLLQLSLPEHMIGAYDDDSGTGFDPEIGPVPLQTTGWYPILLRPNVIGSTGQLLLILSRQQTVLLEDQPIVIELTPKQFIKTVTFDGHAGEQVELTFVLDPLMTTAPLITIIQNGEVIASLENGTAPIFTLEFAVSSDGVVQVNTVDVASGPGTVQISLQRSSP